MMRGGEQALASVARCVLLSAAFTLGIASASLQAAPPPAGGDTPPKVCSRLVLLGTGGGPVIRPTRAQQSTLLVVGNTPYLIDVGAGSMQRLVGAGFSPQDVGAVFITHHHLDHNGGLADFISYSSIGNRRAPVNIVGPAGTEEMIRATYDYMEPSRRAFAAGKLVNSVDPRTIFQGKNIGAEGLIFEDKNIKVFAAENSHYRDPDPAHPSYGADKSYSFRIETASGVVVFTGDTGPSEKVTALAKDADILVSGVADVEGAIAATRALGSFPEPVLKSIASHMSNELLVPTEVGKLATKAQVKLLVLSHYAVGPTKEFSVAPLLDAIRPHYNGPLMAGQDLDVISLPRCR